VGKRFINHHFQKNQKNNDFHQGKSLFFCILALFYCISPFFCLDLAGAVMGASRLQRVWSAELSGCLKLYVNSCWGSVVEGLSPFVLPEFCSGGFPSGWGCRTCGPPRGVGPTPHGGTPAPDGLVVFSMGAHLCESDRRDES